ncbi:MAG: hypothetical protein II297_05275 [Clostridia bacterium]|nr:hypothetical protein [Clostridia bacterium]
MKNNLKFLTCSALLLIFLLFAISCGSKNPPASDQSDTTAPLFVDIHSGATEHNPNTPANVFSRFKHKSVVIAEFGEPIRLSNSEALLTFAGKYHFRGEFNVFPIKIHKKFEATNYSRESFFYTPVLVKKEEDPSIDRTQTYLNVVLDYPNKDDIMTSYDDIILIESAHAADIIVGKQYLVPISYGYADYPHIRLGEYERETAICWMPICDHETSRPDIIPVKDGKICLPDDFYERQPEPDQEYFVKRMATYTEEANEMLTRLGLTDKLFRDGMTIDELDEYFNLVTDELLFAPLFRETE